MKTVDLLYALITERYMHYGSKVVSDKITLALEQLEYIRGKRDAYGEIRKLMLTAEEGSND